jgi:hypothetical protein
MAHVIERPELPSTQQMLDEGADLNTIEGLTDEEKMELLKSLENL